MGGAASLPAVRVLDDALDDTLAVLIPLAPPEELGLGVVAGGVTMLVTLRRGVANIGPAPFWKGGRTRG